MTMIYSTSTCHHCCNSNYLGFFFVCVCLNHLFIEIYTFLMENLVCADWTVQLLVYFGLADLRHKVFKELIYSIRKNSLYSC